jgi:choline dehydrogenase-like flavoprotein
MRVACLVDLDTRMSRGCLDTRVTHGQNSSAMFVDARSLEPKRTLEADVCIAGGGAAGITIALDLVDSGLSVIVIESGGFRRERVIQDLYKGRVVGLNPGSLDEMRVRVLGGSTAHWAGWCRPLREMDFEKRDHVPNSGWPIAYRDLVPYYERACRTVQIGAFDWDASARGAAAKLPLLPAGAGLEHRYYQISPPTHFGSAYRETLEAAGNVQVILRGNVTDVRLESGRGRVQSFVCKTIEGGTFSVEASRYVLALGGIENPRLLLASNSQQREGVANGHDVVGRYFMEHPHYYQSVGMVLPKSTNLAFFRLFRTDLKRPGGDAVQVLGAMGLAPEVTGREKLLSFTAQVHPEQVDTGGMGTLTPAVMQAVVARGRSDFLAGRLTIRTEQSPNPDSRLTLTDERDPLGMPRVALDWRIAPDDNVKVRQGALVLARELSAAGLARLWIPSDEARSRFVWNASPGGHHIGTTRMGTDPATSVVDADCRTHQVRNLYIAGSSVFTTGGDANPTLTLVALAHRLADTFKKAAA